MEMVRIYHPTLDDGNRVVEVPEISLEHHLRGGWIRESDRPVPEKESESESEKEPETETKTAPSTSAKRSTAKKEG